MAGSERSESALRQLAHVLDRSAGEMVDLAERARQLAEQVKASPSLGPVMAAESRPLLVTLLTRLIDRLTEAASEVRRAEAHQLRQEGYTQERVAEVFGVSRQRAAALLKTTAPPRTGPRPGSDREGPAG